MVVGGCVSDDAIAAVAKLYTCPETVAVGVAEVAVPPGAPSEACFERLSVGSGTNARDLFLAPHLPGPDAQIDGLRVDAVSGGEVTIDASLQRVAIAKQGTPTKGGLVLVDVADPTGTHVSLEAKQYSMDWDVSKPSTVGELSLAHSFETVGGELLGFDLPGYPTKVPLKLTADREAEISLNVRLPDPFSGFWSTPFTLVTDNTAGPRVGALKLSFGTVQLGSLAVKGLSLAYAAEGASDVWTGSAGVVVPPGLSLDGKLTLRDGKLEALALTATPPPPGLPVACCLYLVKLGGALAPPFIKADATMGTILQLAGKQLISLAGSILLDYKSISLSFFGKLKALDGMFTLANGHLYASPSSVVFGGGIDKTFAGILEVNASVFGGLYDTGAWYGVGGGKLCVITPAKDFCAGGAVAASNKGISGCFSIDAVVDDVEVGGVVYWNGGWSIFWDCSFSLLKTKVGAPSFTPFERTATARAAEPTTVTLPPGLSRVLFRARGATDAPRVRVTGPDGRTIDAPAASGDYGAAPRWLVLRLPAQRTTDVIVIRPAAGTWRITPLPGSAPITSVGVAEGLPKRLVTASLTGTGRARTLTYKAVLGQGQRLTFIERAARVEHLIHRTTAPAGKLTCSLADAPAGKRRIVAVVESSGVVTRVETVAHLNAPGPIVLPAPKVSVARRPAGFRIRWRPVPGASGYRIRATLSDGRRLFAETAGRSFAAAAVDGRTSGTVTVEALSASRRPGLPGRAMVTELPSISTAPLVSVRELLRVGSIVLRCVPRADGVCTVRATTGGRLLATGSGRARYGRTTVVRARVTAAGRTLLRPGRRLVLQVTATAPGEPSRTVRLRLR